MWRVRDLVTSRLGASLAKPRANMLVLRQTGMSVCAGPVRKPGRGRISGDTACRSRGRKLCLTTKRDVDQRSPPRNRPSFEAGETSVQFQSTNAQTPSKTGEYQTPESKTIQQLTEPDEVRGTILSRSISITRVTSLMTSAKSSRRDYSSARTASQQRVRLPSNCQLRLSRSAHHEIDSAALLVAVNALRYASPRRAGYRP